MSKKLLDLEMSKEKIINDLKKENFTIESYPAIHFIIDKTIKEIKQCIKSACVFYLRYMDNPELLFKEQKEYWKKYKHHLKFGKTADNYEEWLFKLAFKDVLEGERK